MLSVALLLVVIAFGLTLWTRDTNKMPIWIPLLFVEIALLVAWGAGLVIR